MKQVLITMLIVILEILFYAALLDMAIENIFNIEPNMIWSVVLVLVMSGVSSK